MSDEAVLNWSMSQSNWVNNQLSLRLPDVRRSGEGQHVEFMEEYPENGNELSREIAAFASSNEGSIIIGIADDGRLVGLDKVVSAKDRDKLCRRVEGLCTNGVKPSVTPKIGFAKEGKSTVLWIQISRGEQPIYYSNYRPYIRHHSQSRPAEPHEVVERIAEWLKTSPLASQGEQSPEETARSKFFSSLARKLIHVLVFGDELEDRSFDPWLEHLQTDFNYTGQTLRDLAAENTAIDLEMDADLRRLANKLDRAANCRLALGDDSWAELRDHVTEAQELARQIKTQRVDKVSLSANAQSNLVSSIESSVRLLVDLAERARSMARNARIDEVQREASRIGFELLCFSHYQIPGRSNGFAKELRAVGKGLHLLETAQLEMDGGESTARLLDRLGDMTGQLKSLVLQHD